MRVVPYNDRQILVSCTSLDTKRMLLSLTFSWHLMHMLSISAGFELSFKSTKSGSGLSLIVASVVWNKGEWKLLLMHPEKKSELPVSDKAVTKSSGMIHKQGERLTWVIIHRAISSLLVVGWLKVWDHTTCYRIILSSDCREYCISKGSELVVTCHRFCILLNASICYSSSCWL